MPSLEAMVESITVSNIPSEGLVGPTVSDIHDHVRCLIFLDVRQVTGVVPCIRVNDSMFIPNTQVNLG